MGRTTIRRARFAATVAATVLIATTMSGCSLIQQYLPSSQPVRDAGSGEVTDRTDNADVFAVQVGDCMIAVDGEEISNVPIVPCADPHDDEVFDAFSVPGDEFDDDAIQDQAITECDASFAEFIGMSYEDSALDWWPMTPTSESWDNGDREVLCVAFDPTGAQLTGTLRGAAR